ncbi:MFS transporter [Novosphingobium sp. G106]|uniref:MFS transporter n=1 Tax=Novosphingobium sp. G106 TaxID=2849500 RepID=UPI001C2D1629|nr:MFS transporter [Novosphingobium sp. G106]MBV1691606.1 MFS transporter [Novosphingobium sp. G106]
MHDFREFRRHWRPLTASFLGMASGLSLNSFILSTFAPYLIKEFGWSRSQWATWGVIQLLLLVCMPLIGRLTDLFGVRLVASIGAIVFPLSLFAIAGMNGSVGIYLAIYVTQTVLCATTTSTVYSRPVAEAFSVRRGVALAIVGSAPPLVAALGSPLISAFVGQHGWRAGYVVMAIYCAVCAAATIALLPRRRPLPRATPESLKQRRSGVYREIVRMPAFWIMLAACFLVNLPFTLAISQLKMVVLDQGITDADAAMMVSIFAVGSIVGRIVAGFGLDALPAHIIAAVSFGLPFIGLLLLASPYDSVPMVGFAILLMGLSFGGEGDVVPFLVTRYFDIGVFSTVLGLLTASIASAMAIGNVALGLVLARTNSFDLYLVIAAAGAFIGSSLFLLLGLHRFRPAEREVIA